MKPATQRRLRRRCIGFRESERLDSELFLDSLLVQDRSALICLLRIEYSVHGIRMGKSDNERVVCGKLRASAGVIVFEMTMGYRYGFEVGSSGVISGFW